MPFALPPCGLKCVLCQVGGGDLLLPLSDSHRCRELKNTEERSLVDFVRQTQVCDEFQGKRRNMDLHVHGKSIGCGTKLVLQTSGRQDIASPPGNLWKLAVPGGLFRQLTPKPRVFTPVENWKNCILSSGFSLLEKVNELSVGELVIYPYTTPVRDKGSADLGRALIRTLGSDSFNSPALFPERWMVILGFWSLIPHSEKQIPSIPNNVGFTVLRTDPCFSTKASTTHRQHMLSHLDLCLEGGHHTVEVRLTLQEASSRHGSCAPLTNNKVFFISRNGVYGMPG